MHLSKPLLLAVALPLASWVHAQVGEVRGIVRDGDEAVPFATVEVVGGPVGTSTNENGAFTIASVPTGAGRLLISAVGRTPLSIRIMVEPGRTLDLGVVQWPSDANELSGTVVTGTLREVSRADSPVPVEVITPAFFRKNPSPALFDAVGMVNGVRPQVNCSVCNTGDIHINGMEGPYTMVLIDGMPIVSGLSTVYGLSGIPTSLVERVEVVKGPGSALYGSEAMGGIINVITKSPALAPKLSADVFGTTWQEWNADIGARFGTGKVSDLLGVSYFHYDTPTDRNRDGFTDVTLQKRLSVFNKVDVQRPERRVASMALRYVTEDRWGGEMDWTAQDRGSSSVYGENILTDRWELIGQYQLPMKERVVLQASFNTHQQDSWYGKTRYTADQRVFFAQTIWSKRFAARHDVLAGVAFRHTYYEDNTTATARSPQRTPLPGFFLQEEWSATEAHKILLGYRFDHDAVHGPVHSPRLAYKWAPSGRWAVRAGFGTGYRVVNLFTEDHAALTGAREVLITEELQPERSINGTLNLTRRWAGEKRALVLDLSLFHTRFSNRILPDYYVDPDLIVYDNLDGHGISQGISLNVESRLGRYLKAFAGATWLDVHTVELGVRREQLFAPDWSGTFTLTATIRKQWTVDLTGQWYGPMLLPVLPNDYRDAWSPAYALVNLQVRRTLGERFELYGGVKNLLDFVPSDPLMRPEDPFDQLVNDPVGNPNGYTFDTAYMYAPLQGARGFLGARFTF